MGPPAGPPAWGDAWAPPSPPARPGPNGVNVAIAAGIGVGLLVIVALLAITFLGRTTPSSFSGSAAPTTAGAAGGDTFTDPNGRFTMSTGPTWTVNPALGSIPTWNIGSAGPTVADNVIAVASASPTSISLNDAIQGDLQGLVSVKGLTVVANDRITLPNGDPAGLVTLENRMSASGRVIHQQQLIVVKGRITAVVTVSTAAADPQAVFDAAAPYVRSITIR